MLLPAGGAFDFSRVYARSNQLLEFGSAVFATIFVNGHSDLGEAPLMTGREACPTTGPYSTIKVQILSITLRTWLELPFELFTRIENAAQLPFFRCTYPDRLFTCDTDPVLA
jgi:hypothetical protein